MELYGGLFGVGECDYCESFYFLYFRAWFWELDVSAVEENYADIEIVRCNRCVAYALGGCVYA